MDDAEFSAWLLGHSDEYKCEGMACLIERYDHDIAEAADAHANAAESTGTKGQALDVEEAQDRVGALPSTVASAATLWGRSGGHSGCAGTGARQASPSRIDQEVSVPFYLNVWVERWRSARHLGRTASFYSNIGIERYRSSRHSGGTEPFTPSHA